MGRCGARIASITPSESLSSIATITIASTIVSQSTVTMTRSPGNAYGIHVNADGEWSVFEFARTFDDDAAKLSISMGLPQIMGFNYRSVGYESVDAMFDAFSRDD